MNNNFDAWIESGCWRRETIDGKEYPVGNVFVKDGPIDKNEFEKSNYRIVFITKECYLTKEDYEVIKKECENEENMYCNLIDDFENKFINGESNNRYWRRISEWAYIINSLRNNIDPGFYRALTKEEYKKTVENVAIVNLKKSDGKSSTNYYSFMKYFAPENEYEDSAKEYNDHLKQQLQDLNPNIIICCGSGVLDVMNNYLYKDSITCTKGNDRFYKLDYKGSTIPIINYIHPSNFFFYDDITYYGFAKTIEQFYDKNRK